MELDILPATVYQPRAGQAPARALNTIMEEEVVSRTAPQTRPKSNLESPTRLPQTTFVPQRPAPPKPAVAAKQQTPRISFSPASSTSSPLSSVESASLTWASSDTGSTIDTNTDFEDLYDADGKDDIIEVMLVEQPTPQSIARSRSRRSLSPPSRKPRYPPLAIPPTRLAHAAYPGQKDSPVPPTPPPKIPISPAILSRLAQPRSIPSAPPSLDGSSTSEQLSHMEAPSTPSIGTPDEGAANGWGQGVQLSDAALATLQMLSNAGILESPAATTTEGSRASEGDAPATFSRRHTVELQTPSSGRSRLGSLDIPSPGGFFSSLGAGARHTWCPPSSTTAERFYECAWDRPTSRITERILEVDDIESNGPTTAHLITPRAIPVPTESGVGLHTSEDDFKPDEQDRKTALASPSSALDRTASWLSTQLAYIQPSIEPRAQIEDAVVVDVEFRTTTVDEAQDADRRELDVPVSNSNGQSTNKAHKQVVESSPIFWRVFASLVHGSGLTDPFVHCQSRFDAVQTKRICAPVAHYGEVRGEFIIPTVEPAKDRFADEPTAAQVQAAEQDVERKAAMRVLHPLWNVMAFKFLNGGKLLSDPAVKMLAKTLDTSVESPGSARILDLAGDAACGWAWLCADEYSKAQVHTVLPMALNRSAIMTYPGPPNHSQSAVAHLWKLPFPDNHFDVVSTRSVHMFLKTERPMMESVDEYDLCLRECWRCLKPGGFLEFSLLDSDLRDAGPLGTAMSVEFGFKLRTRGYDPAPTRTWLSRLKRAGFDDIKRMWLFLPMGAPYLSKEEGSDSDGSITSHSGAGSQSLAKGDGQSVDAISGLVGLRAWEQWMLLLQAEATKVEDYPLEGVGAVVQEGRTHRTGWRGLSGRARKPLVS
ncbi:MAG: hypothetical protein M1823_004466 [Watsoniomyces obsoletus]|nr:MAG: hypothetical protein M1823_004466 [Watsoniomyces obsoletus]